MFSTFIAISHFSIMTCCAKKCFSKKPKNGKEGEGEDDGDNEKQKNGHKIELAVHMNGKLVMLKTTQQVIKRIIGMSCN